jgi:hypothetical protein
MPVIRGPLNFCDQKRSTAPFKTRTLVSYLAGAVLERLKTELDGLTAPESGSRAAERVTATDVAFPGPRRADLPDLSISWHADARIVDAVDSTDFGRIKKQLGYATSPFYTGNHRPTAFALVAGAGAGPKLQLERAHVVDLAPSILSRLGVDVPRHYEGTPFRGLG